MLTVVSLPGGQVGYSEKTLSQFVLAMAKKATSARGLLGQLMANDFTMGPKLEAFATTLFSKASASRGTDFHAM
jgi:putative exporter of polyketide antibiotics